MSEQQNSSLNSSDDNLNEDTVEDENNLSQELHPLLNNFISNIDQHQNNSQNSPDVNNTLYFRFVNNRTQHWLNFENQLMQNIIEERELERAMLESREMYDSMDVIEKIDANKLTIESKKYSTLKIKHKRKQLCLICHEKFSCNQQVYNLIPCKHIFHKCCLDEWVKYKPDCPICRNNLEIISNQGTNSN